MIAHECTTDLPERQRRARFSSNEQRALEAHFAVCASCRAARQMIADFEQLGTVEPTDGARIERLAARARLHVARAPVVAPVRSAGAARKSKLVRALAIAAALALLVGSAFAGARSWRANTAARRVSNSAVGRAASLAAVTQSAPAASSPSAASSAPATVAELPAVSSSALSSPSHVPDPASAALLLREAGDALRRGQRDPAAQLYQRLQAQYPASAEALVSHVSLGRLFAERGQPRAAVREFDRYLSAAHGGVLIPEALYGRARALTGLGDRADEARTWAQLLREFPDSAYADRARRRLAELE